MKTLINILIVLFYTLSFSQELRKKTTCQIDLENSVECISVALMLPDSDLSISIIKQDIKVTANNYDHFYIKTNSIKMATFVEILAKSELLNEMYLIPFNQEYAYQEINSKKVNDGKDVKLLIQISYNNPCHTDELFILISDKIDAEKLTKKLLKLFDNNVGLLKLNKQLKM